MLPDSYRYDPNHHISIRNSDQDLVDVSICWQVDRRLYIAVARLVVAYNAAKRRSEAVKRLPETYQEWLRDFRRTGR